MSASDSPRSHPTRVFHLTHEKQKQKRDSTQCVQMKKRYFKEYTVSTHDNGEKDIHVRNVKTDGTRLSALRSFLSRHELRNVHLADAVFYAAGWHREKTSPHPSWAKERPNSTTTIPQSTVNPPSPPHLIPTLAKGVCRAHSERALEVRRAPATASRARIFLGMEFGNSF